MKMCIDKEKVEKQINAKHGTHWCSSPVIASAVCKQFKCDPRVGVESSTSVPYYADLRTEYYEDLRVALQGLREGYHPIATDEHVLVWRRATKQNGKPPTKMKLPVDSSYNLCYRVTNEVGVKYAFVAEPPSVLELEDFGAERPGQPGERSRRLHCDTGPALVWGDFTVWFIHGVVVNEQIVMRPETQTPDQILKDERNEEVRRVRMERYGMVRLMEHSVTLDRRDNDVECTKEVLIKIGDMKFLVCHCPSTGRVYHLQVPFGDVATCEQAQRWLWQGAQRALEEYRPVTTVNIVGRS